MAGERERTSTMSVPLPGAPPPPAVPRPERFRLDNGLRVVAVQRKDFPQIAARLVIDAGSSADPSAAPGAASLVGSLLTEGTDQHDAVELNTRIDSLGAAVSARVGHDFTEIEFVLLAETLPSGLELLTELVTIPAFPEREMERVRAEALDALEARLDEPANVADDLTAENVFGGGHPYGRLPIGTPDGVRAIRRSDLTEFHRTRYRPEGSVLVIAGDFEAATFRRILDHSLGLWEGAAAPTVRYPTPRVPKAAGSLVAVARDDAPQAEIRFAGLGLPRTSSAWIPAGVANYILGGSTITGRLGANLREDKGWTYGVRSSFAAGVQPAGWVVETAVGVEVAWAATEEISHELERMATEPVSEEELVRAREAMVLSLPRAFETPARIVSRLATVEAFDLPRDYWDTFPDAVQRVTREDVQRIAREFFEPSGLVRVVVGPDGEG